MADILRPTKTAISQQISSARSSRLLCSNLPAATHRPKDSSGPGRPVPWSNPGKKTQTTHYLQTFAGRKAPAAAIKKTKSLRI